MSRVAVVHDWLTTFAGSEKVVEQILEVFPEADVFTLIDVLPRVDRGFLNGRKVRTSVLQHAPFIRKYYRFYLPAMPLAIESLDVRGYELVISSSHAVAKGVRTGPDQLHISYIHSPMRYAWDMQADYFGEKGLKSLLAKMVLLPIRSWDRKAAARPANLLANSHFVAQRVRQFYGRDATVIYPPVDVDFFQPGSHRGGYYLTVSRLVPYKHVELIARAFAEMPDRRLVIIGDGERAAALNKLLTPNINWLGRQSNEAIRQHMQDCRAFVFAARDDFGITPVEAQACGAPVIAFAEGGATESIRGLDAAEPTGVFFNTQSVEALKAAIVEFERHADRIAPGACRQNAMQFPVDRFRRELAEYVEIAEREFRSHRAAVRQAAHLAPRT